MSISIEEFVTFGIVLAAFMGILIMLFPIHLYWARKLSCPMCRKALVITGRARLETLTEHVSSPDGPVSMKDVWQCLNYQCLLSAYGYRWEEVEGGCYTLNEYKTHQEMKKLVPFGIMSAVGSIGWKIDFRFKSEKLLTFKFNWKKYQISARLYQTPCVSVYERMSDHTLKLRRCFYLRAYDRRRIEQHLSRAPELTLVK